MSPRSVLLIVAVAAVLVAAPTVVEAQSTAAARVAAQRQASAYYQARARYHRIRTQNHHWIGAARDAINRYGVSDKVRKHRRAARKRSAMQRRKVAKLRAQLKKDGTEVRSGQQERVNPFLRSAQPGSDQPFKPIRQTPPRGLGTYLAIVD